MIWKDATGKFSVEARYISRTQADVTIRKADGSELTVPIANLQSELRKQVARTPITSDITAPIRVGDKVEVEHISTWYVGTVKSILGEQATVEYDKGGDKLASGNFGLKAIRFPNGEGHWMVWKDSSGEFKVEARYISRTATEVTLRKVDGTDLTIPIDKLHPSLRQRVVKAKITSELNKIDGAIPIRVGDRVQIKGGSSWYDGVVKEITLGGALVDYTYGSWGLRRKIVPMSEMRYPNFEGPWQEWSDVSGAFKVIARYLSRDATHVTLLKEDDTELRVPIEKIAGPLRNKILNTRVVSRRPRAVPLAGADLIGDMAEGTTASPSLRRNGQTVTSPELSDLVIEVGSPVSEQTVSLPQGRAGFLIGKKFDLDQVVPVGGSEALVLVSTHGNFWGADALTELRWASLANGSVTPGPRFFPDQRLAAFSAAQKRLVMYTVNGSWDEPSQVSTYRMLPGEGIARAEMTFDIPKMKRTYHREPIRIELVGDDMMLFGYGRIVSLWDLKSRRVLYEVSKLGSHDFRLSIDHRYFAVVGGNKSLDLYEVSTGKQVGQSFWEGYGTPAVCFSHDWQQLADGDFVWHEALESHQANAGAEAADRRTGNQRLDASC